MDGPVAIVVFVVSLVLAILLHELGHMLTAKRFGMRVDKYFVGFGPTLWSTRRGETEYGVKAFPLGGFVRIVGMAPTDERRRPILDEVFDRDRLERDRRSAAEASGSDALAQPNLPEPTWERLATSLTERGTPPEVVERVVRRTRATLPEHPTGADGRGTLHQVLVTELGVSERFGDLPYRVFEGDRGRFYLDRPAWQRAVAIFTGPVTHLVIAFGALLALYLFLPQLSISPVVEEVLPGSPAEEAGLQEGDRVLAVGDVRSDEYPELAAAIRARPGQPTILVVGRAGTELSFEVVPEPQLDEATGERIGLVGFRPSIEEVRYGPLEAATRAAIGRPDAVGSPGGVIPLIGASVGGLVRIFSPQGLGALVTTAAGGTERGEETPISLIGAASIAGQGGEGAQSVALLLVLIAVINVFFFVFNLVPLPPFDGGHLAVLAIERSVNAFRSLRGRAADYQVDPRAIVAVTLPVLVVLGTVLLATLWLDITNPLDLG
jgi:regulator of sigma E protease